MWLPERKKTWIWESVCDRRKGWEINKGWCAKCQLLRLHSSSGVLELIWMLSIQMWPVVAFSKMPSMTTFNKTRHSVLPWAWPWNSSHIQLSVHHHHHTLPGIPLEIEVWWCVPPSTWNPDCHPEPREVFLLEAGHAAGPAGFPRSLAGRRTSSTEALHWGPPLGWRSELSFPASLD